MARLYRLEEAEALLPQVIPILESIRDGHEALAEGEGELEMLLAPGHRNGHSRRLDDVRLARERLMASQGSVRAALAKLQEWDVELKDPATGLIDFQSRFQGRIVYLCWRLGEPRIDWWHEMDAGFAGRKRLERAD